MRSDFDEDVGIWYECANCDYREQISSATPAQPEGEQEKRDQQREADAKIADSFRYGWNSENTFCQVAETIAAAIRAEKGK